MTSEQRESLITHYNQILKQSKRTQTQARRLTEKADTLASACRGAALRGLHWRGPASSGALKLVSEEHTQTGVTEMSKKKAKVTVALEDALHVALTPLVNILDQNASTDQGHDLPSRTDKTIAIFLSNLCRDTYQQIYGMPATATFRGFGGIKESWDRAQTAIAKLVSDYSNNPDDITADPNFLKFASWEQQAQAKYETLVSILDSFMSVYRSVTGTDWVYVAPGSQPSKTVDKSAAVARFREISSNSRLIPAQAQ